jgi:hypothetical protein
MSTVRTAKTDNRRADIEQILTAHGVTFTYKGVVLITEIERHKESQSRLRDTDKALVKEYVEKMKQGAIFPPVILWEDGYEGYGIVDGNTRVEAKKARKETTVDAYIVNVSDSNEAIYVSAIFNATHGQRLSKEEIHHAVIAAGLMDNPPTNEQLAKDYGLTVQMVSSVQNIHRVTGELTALGIDPVAIADSAKVSLAKLADTAVKRDLANLIIDSDMKQTEIRHLCNEISKQGSEADRLRVVAEARSDRAAQITAKKTGRVVKNQPIGRISMAMGLILSVKDANPAPEQWIPVDDARRADLLEKYTSVRDWLNSVIETAEVSH